MQFSTGLIIENIYIYTFIYNIKHINFFLYTNSLYSFLNIFRVCKILHFVYSRSTSALQLPIPFQPTHQIKSTCFACLLPWLWQNLKRSQKMSNLLKRENFQLNVQQTWLLTPICSNSYWLGWGVIFLSTHVSKRTSSIFMCSCVVDVKRLKWQLLKQKLLSIQNINLLQHVNSAFFSWTSLILILVCWKRCYVVNIHVHAFRLSKTLYKYFSLNWFSIIVFFSS